MKERIYNWLWNLQGLNCRHALRMASRSLDEPLSLGERAKLALHNSLCIYCLRYRRQIRLLRHWLKRLGAESSPLEDVKLPPEYAFRIKEKLREESV